MPMAIAVLVTLIYVFTDAETNQTGQSHSPQHIGYRVLKCYSNW